MTFEQYIGAAAGLHWAMPGIRAGQAAFNVLATHRPDLSEQVRGDTNLDPFYQDDRLPAFYAWLAEHWGEVT